MAISIDSQTRALLEQMAAAGVKPLHESTPEELRTLGRTMAEQSGPGPEMGRVEEHQVRVAGGVVPVRVLVPPQTVRGVMVFCHGGGWVMGGRDDYDAPARMLAERTSCALVLPEYRLAPEHPYPAAVDDCQAVLEWAGAHVVDLAGAEVPLFVAGDSAGGNLAAVVARRIRDRGGPRIAMQVLIYPVVDCDLDRPSYVEPDNQLLLTRAAMRWFWAQYVPEPARRFEADASPLRAADLSGLPPAVVLTAEHDVLRDEGEAYARRLEAAGVPVDCRRHAQQMHGFFTLAMLPASERGFQQIVRAVRACITRQSGAPVAMSAAGERVVSTGDKHA